MAYIFFKCSHSIGEQYNMVGNEEEHYFHVLLIALEMTIFKPISQILE